MAPPPGPLTIEQYIDWAKTAITCDFAAVGTRNRYETNVQTAQNTIQESPFLRGLSAFLEEHNADCERRTGADLLMSRELTVLRKPYSSAVEKSFRWNVLRNRSFPNPPRDGWVTPENWYTRFDDLVRATLVCKFLDGPSVLAQSLDQYAIESGFKGRHIPRSTDQGYYAFHHYTAFPVAIVDSAWDTQTIVTELEIQLTTQLQEVLRQLTHPLYEQARTKAPERDDRWKWDHETPRFRTSYLGHTLHMIEAIIVQVRDSVKPQASNAEPAGEVPEQEAHARIDSAAGAQPVQSETLVEPNVERAEQ
jgi:hypothetical protein